MVSEGVVAVAKGGNKNNKKRYCEYVPELCMSTVWIHTGSEA